MIYLSIIDFITEVFKTIGTVIEKFVALLVDLFEKVVGLFWVEAVGTTGQGGYEPAHLTVLGVLLLISVATALTMWAFRFIRSLLRVKTK